MQKPSKKLRAALKDHASRAWEAEMRSALEVVAAKFDQWKVGTVSTSERNEAIHDYHNGAAREIWRQFATRDPALPLARAVASGIISRDSLPAEVAEHLAPMVESFLELDREDRHRHGTDA